MEIKGIIKKVLEKKTGTSQRGEWVKQDFILETLGEYPKQVCISIWGDEMTVNIGQVINAHINIESREYNERYYTDVKCWKIDVKSKPNQEQQNTDSFENTTDLGKPVDDGQEMDDSGLPF